MKAGWIARACAALMAVLAASAASAADTYDTVASRTFQDAQMALSSRAAVALAQTSARLAARDPVLNDIVMRRAAAEQRWHAAEEGLTRALSQGRSTDATNLRATLEDAATQAKGLDAQLRSGFPQFADLSSPSPLSVAEAQQLLGPDEALLVILQSVDGSFLWALRRDRMQWARGEMDDKAVAQAVRKLRLSLDPAGSTRAAVDAAGSAPQATGPQPFPRALAHELYKSIWGPVAGAIGDARTVYVVSGEELATLPLATLVEQPPKGDDADPAAVRATPWLIKHYALVTLPSVASLRSLRQVRSPEGQAPFAGFGAPSLGAPATQASVRGLETYYRGVGGADLSALKGLPSLPGARTELFSMAKAMRAPAASVRLGGDATETAVKGADLSRTRVVAFATHGLLAGEISGLQEPALVFTPPAAATDTDDGLLTASEAAGLRLSADWVVLSACNTASSDGAPGGEGLSGLARAFFYAGAKAVMVSHWRVRDDAAARLTTAAVADYQQHPQRGRAEALRRSMLALMQDRRDPSLAQPALWAPFVLAGEGR